MSSDAEVSHTTEVDLRVSDVISERILHNDRTEIAQFAIDAGLYPYFRTVQSAATSEITVEGERRVNLASNNYLSLSYHPRVIEATIAATRKYGAGIGGSRFLNGTLDLHEEFEDELRDFYGRDGALVVTTGYGSNLALLSGLLGKDDIAVVDDEAHNSLHSGLRLSGATIERFRHNDLDHLAEVLASIPDGVGKVVIVDGVYSMAGDLAPLTAIVDLCHRTPNTLSVIDEAHGLGVVGGRGLGAVELFDVVGEVDFITLTFSKSLGSCGGAIVGSGELIDALKLTARMNPFIFTASNTPGSVAAALESLHILREHPELVVKLSDNVSLFEQALTEHGVPVTATESAILTIPLYRGDDLSTVDAGAKLLNAGLYCNAVLYPAVEADHGLLRFSLMADHTESQLEFAADTIARTLSDLGQLAPREEAA